MRVLVCGGRDYGDAAVLGRFLDALHHERAFSTLIEGGARGADRLARRWAQSRGVQVVTYPAQWDAFGKRAGFLRNRQMLEEGRPDMVVAFPGGRGTLSMVMLAVEASVPVAAPDQCR